MNTALVRNHHDSVAIEKRRLVVAVAILIVLSAFWHVFRGTCIQSFATASVGCYWRDSLIRAGLRSAGFDISDTDGLRSSCLPRPGWIAWSSPHQYESLPTGAQLIRRWQTSVLDSEFRILGTVPTGIDVPPMDIDGDGFWEVRIGAPAAEATKSRILAYDAVVRMKPSGNEIIWLGLDDDNSWRARGIRIYPIWSDTNGDGMQELVFITVTGGATASGEYVFKPPQIVASFEVDRPGGLLRPDRLPADCGITSWTPPNDAPVRLDPTVALDQQFHDLLPVPDRSDK